MRGKEHDGLIHIADWHSTFIKLAGLDPVAGEPHANSAIDGVDAWPWLSGAQAKSNRHELIYDHHMFKNATTDPSCLNVSGRCLQGAIQQDGLKLVVGPESQNDWFGWFSPNASHPVNKSSPCVTRQACAPPDVCLFNISADMTEHVDIAAQQPQLVTKLLARFKALGTTYHPPQLNPKVDLDGYCKAVELNGGFVGPWMQHPNAATRS